MSDELKKAQEDLATALKSVEELKTSVSELTTKLETEVKAKADIVSQRDKLKGDLKAVQDEKLKGTDDVEALKKMIQEQTDAANTATEQLKTQAREFAVKQALVAAGLQADQMETAMKLADLSGVALDDKNQPIGADKVAEAVKGSVPALFKKPAADPNIGDPKPTVFEGTDLNPTPEKIEQMSDAELVDLQTKRIKHEQANPSKFLPGMDPSQLAKA